ncbi:hypothetical protein GCM10022247_01110 [Allokutzneria multivorans]|uniref:Sigma-70 family RNA polymerase sigma factor n=1 Tax=Allokutzneria multivorans TaxID=1142134 RepID=A0ABP7QQI8_9PSEU
MSSALHGAPREASRCEVVVVSPGADQAEQAVDAYRRLRRQSKELHVITRSRVLKNRIRAAMPFESRADVVFTYHTYFGDLWRAALGTRPPRWDDYDIDYWEFKRLLRARHVRPLHHRHVVVVNGQQLPYDFYAVLRLLGVGATVFVDPVLTVDDSGTPLDTILRVLRVEEVARSRGAGDVTAQIHQLLTRLGDGHHAAELPQREGPKPVLVDHEDVHEEIRFVVDLAMAHRDRQIGVLVPNRELVHVFREGISDHFDGPTQWYASGTKVPRHAEISVTEPGVKVLTWASAPCMRFDSVVLAGLDHVDDRFRFENMLQVLGPTARAELVLSYSGVGRPTALAGLSLDLVDDRTRQTSGEEWVDFVVAPAPSTPRPDSAEPLTIVALSAVESARALLAKPVQSEARSKCLLTAEQEVGLAQLMRPADGELSEELARGFRSRLRHDDERARAFDAMVLHNIGLVGSCVSRYLGAGLDDEDLRQHGVLGLMRAIEKWDGSRGLKFSTYAVNWINQAMGRAIPDEATTIRLPVHKHEEVRKVMATRKRLLREQKDFSVRALAEQTGFSPAKVVECLRLARGVVSLDTPLGAHGEISFAELVPAPFEHESNPDYVVDRAAGAELVRRALLLLKDREAEVLRLRFGLDDDEERTLDRVGEHFSFTRERARQIESKAKSKLVEKLAEVGLFGGPSRTVVPPPPKQPRHRLVVVPPQRSAVQVRGAEIATGTSLPELMGSAERTCTVSSLLVALTDRALRGGALKIAVRTAGEGPTARLAFVHDGEPFADSALRCALSAGGTPSNDSTALGIAASLYDEITTWNRGASSECSVLTVAAHTGTWWLRSAARRVPAGLPSQEMPDPTSILLLRVPRLRVARASTAVILDRCVSDLGVVFGEVLAAGAVIDVNGRAVGPQDPFLWGNPAGQHLGEEHVSAAGFSVLVSPRVLPHPRALRAGDVASVGDPSRWRGSQGFYLRCGGRYLSCGGWLGLDDLDMAAHTALARVLVEVPPTERAAWGEDQPGALFTPPEPLRQRLVDLARIARNKSELVFGRDRTGGMA